MSERTTLSVLVVDDDFHVAGLHASHVAQAPGFTVVATAQSAEQAREVVREQVVDLALVDVYLPDGSGVDLVRELPCDCFVLSAATEGRTVRAALSAGALAYLAKPFPPQRLIDRLRGYARYRRALDSAHVDQDTIDEAVATLSAPAPRRDRPTGAHAATRQLVLATVRQTADAVSAAEVGRSIGISRATAQRHLAGLCTDGLLRMRLRYGATGRPEQEYRPAG
ncbi:response regulator [Streptomyces endophyticus]|uniref:Transcriptional regulatory protein n=1 Tax=Streptomyces endophyticus TaxID=714166 RepID=A0ABU6FAJ2_9ACTN|nr:response regulator [Streptomyces endophyticus]MEB8340622.1 response regulator [Streptomyces endophyticus]